jgi:hypothetical protein
LPGGGAQNQTAGGQGAREEDAPTAGHEGNEEGAEPFISEEEVRATASMPVQDYDEVTCNKCGNRMYVRTAKAG